MSIEQRFDDAVEFTATRHYEEAVRRTGIRVQAMAPWWMRLLRISYSTYVDYEDVIDPILEEELSKHV